MDIILPYLGGGTKATGFELGFWQMGEPSGIPELNFVGLSVKKFHSDGNWRCFWRMLVTK